jgi:hypothetical protein
MEKHIGKKLLSLSQDIQMRMDNLEEIFRSPYFLDPVLDKLWQIIENVYEIDPLDFDFGDKAVNVITDCAIKEISITEADKRLKEISKEQNKPKSS